MAFAYDVLGNCTQMTDSSGTTNYEYNPFEELTTETKDDILKSYTYDSIGRRTAFSVTNGANNVISNTYGYDSVGRLTSVVNGQDYVEYTYDGNSNLLTSSVNGVLKSESTYNVGNLPKVIRQYASGELQDTSTYVYNEDGTLYRSVTERATGEEQQLSYNYDYMGRMYSESVFTKDKNTGYVTTWLDYSISYDEYGNIDWEYRVDRMLNTELMVENTFDTANKITQTRVKDLKISDGDQYISDTAYTYNTNGAITAITENGELKKSFEYDGFGRLSRTLVDGTESEYTYNGDNLRQTKSVDGALTTHILDGANVVADISDSGTKTFVRGNSLELFKTQGGSTKTYLNSYPRNDVSALVDSDGSVSDYIYTAYGEKIGTNDNTENPFGYCGEYFDTETGLVYLRNRYYDPTMHRFISEDPAKDGLNWYAYAGCNPTKYVDPNGTDAIIITSESAAYGRGHTSVLYQDAKGEWYYTYWGNAVAAVIHIPKTYIKEYRRNGDVTANSMASLNDFKKCLERIVSENGFNNITLDYTDATYVFGDFTESLNAAYDDVREASLSNNSCYRGLTSKDDGTLVYQGTNRSYNLFLINCFNKSYDTLSKGTLPNKENVGTYMIDLGMRIGMVPNNQVDNFSQIFMNTSFTQLAAYYSVKDYARAYDEKSPWAKKAEKAEYAKSVKLQ